MDAVLKKIIAVANQYSVGKAVLFGSRARGDSTKKSDYDIAFILPCMTDDTKNKILNELEELDTLYKIDAVFLESLDGDDELTKNIRKDGIVLMDKQSLITSKMRLLLWKRLFRILIKQLFYPSVTA